MEVGQHHAPDLGWAETSPLHGDQRRGAAVDQNGLARPGEVEAGLEAPPAAEGVTRTEKLKANAIRFRRAQAPHLSTRPASLRSRPLTRHAYFRHGRSITSPVGVVMTEPSGMTAMLSTAVSANS